MEPDDMVDAVSYLAKMAMVKMEAKMDAQLVAALGIPPVFAGVASTNYSGANKVSTLDGIAAWEARRARWRLGKELRRDAAIFWIAGRLTDWITTNRHKLASRLWIAQGVFEHNLRAMAAVHRLLPPGEPDA